MILLPYNFHSFDNSHQAYILFILLLLSYLNNNLFLLLFSNLNLNLAHISLKILLCSSGLQVAPRVERESRPAPQWSRCMWPL